MSQSSNLVELAKNVARAQEALDRALEALWAATGRPTRHPRQAKPRPGPKAVGGVSISQAVLDRVTAGPTGETRANLIATLGHPDAVSSALKKHRAAGRIQPIGEGRWVAGSGAPAPKKRAR
jgi:hypothetical protein